MSISWSGLEHCHVELPHKEREEKEKREKREGRKKTKGKRKRKVKEKRFSLGFEDVLS